MHDIFARTKKRPLCTILRMNQTIPRHVEKLENNYCTPGMTDESRIIFDQPLYLKTIQFQFSIYSFLTDANLHEYPITST